MNKKVRNQEPEPRWIGLIDLSIFRQTIPVFISEEDHVHEARARGLNAVAVSGPWDAMACEDVHENGTKSFCLVIPPEATQSTWAHEAVHIADMLMDYVGIPCDANNTEIRAYLVGYIFERLDVIFDDYYMKHPDMDPFRKAS